MRNPFNPPPAPPAFGEGKVLPERTSSYFSQLIFQWLDPFLYVGFTRPLQENDLWQLPDDRLTAKITDDVERKYYARCPPEKRPKAFRENQPTTAPLSEKALERNAGRRQANVPEKQPVYDESIFKALHTSFFKRIWIAGILHLIADVLRTTTPLVTKVLLTWLTTSYAYHRLPDEQKASGIIKEPQGVGYGIGLAFALFAMQRA
ncbi:hypothetical protein DXG03_009433 [Asterophora parasitica]|uniref:Uncharacterized protein n=1 Tax=Asterophora parasitica TaxID=117018 RepID=A0A9P7GCT1_9AGAR|nr:hypothetical protein DXG03_009433 [Asterophora parasitica]